jgi:tetratricopeptide (TPR) repeat protein
VKRLLALVSAIAACAVLGGTVTAARPPVWSRVVSAHFVVSGDAPKGDVETVSALLEVFREVFRRVLPNARDRALLPPFVIVFGSRESFEPYRPLMGGKPAPVGGYVVREPLIPCVALMLDRSGESYRTVFHEYAHVLFDAPRVPLWLSEGIADYYSTTTLNRDRRRVLIGGVVQTHVQRMIGEFMPLSDLLTTTRSAKIWDTSAGRLFYAESWALVHYFLMSSSQGQARIARYLQLLESGLDERTAFESAFGSVSAVESHLRRYVRDGWAPPKEDLLPEQVLVERRPPRPMTNAEVEATLGRLLFQLQRDQEAQTRLESAIRLDPRLPEANAMLGLLRFRQNRMADAVAPFEAANAGDPGNLLVAHDLALAILESSRDDGSLQRGYDALARLVGADGPSEPMAVLGTIAGRLGRLDEAERWLRQALERAPGRRAAELELADVCLRVGRYAEARRLLGPVGRQDAAAERALGSTEPVNEEIVAQRLGWVTMAEARARMRDELATAAGLSNAGPDIGIARTGRFPMPTIDRALVAGEHRQLGWLDAVACSDNGFSATMTTTSGVRTFRAPSTRDVAVTTYRDDAGLEITCGPRANREAVSVIWREEPPSAGAGRTPSDGRLVTLVFLPRDLAPAASR